MIESDIRYFNFPIVLLKDFMVNSSECLQNIIDYAIYDHLDKEYKGNIEFLDEVESFFGVTLGNRERTYNNGKMLFDSIDSNSPKVGINKLIYFDYYKSIDQKSDFDKVVLLAFLAIKSILMNKAYCKITNNYLYARMAGYPKKIESVSELPKELIKYTNVYQTRKFKDELKLNWNLIHYANYTRGFYVSLKLTYVELGIKVEKSKKSYKLKLQNAKQKENDKIIMEKLKK